MLLLNQKHVKEMPFFEQILHDFLRAGKTIPKIIGHPISLLLVFLIDKNHKYNQAIGDLMKNYKDLKPKALIK